MAKVQESGKAQAQAQARAQARGGPKPWQVGKPDPGKGAPGAKGTTAKGTPKVCPGACHLIGVDF